MKNPWASLLMAVCAAIVGAFIGGEIGRQFSSHLLGALIGGSVGFITSFIISDLPELMAAAKTVRQREITASLVSIKKWLPSKGFIANVALILGFCTIPLILLFVIERYNTGERLYSISLWLLLVVMVAFGTVLPILCAYVPVSDVARSISGQCWIWNQFDKSNWGSFVNKLIYRIATERKEKAGYCYALGLRLSANLSLGALAISLIAGFSLMISLASWCAMVVIGLSSLKKRLHCGVAAAIGAIAITLGVSYLTGAIIVLVILCPMILTVALGPRRTEQIVYQLNRIHNVTDNAFDV